MNEAVYQALVTQLKTVAGLPTLQLENTVVQAKGSFMRATLIRSRPEQLTVGASGRDLHGGLFQVDIFVPVNTGTTAANVLADKVIDAFPRGLAFNLDGVQMYVRIAYRETAGRINDQFHQVPVVVEWQAIA